MALRQLPAWRSVFIKSASSSELRILVDAGFCSSQVRTLTRGRLITPSFVLRRVQERNAIVRQFRLQTDVAMMLTNRLIETEAKDKNFVYSPVSIHLALPVLAAGAKGKTLDQLLSFLKLESKANWRRLSFVSWKVDVLLKDGAGRGPKLAVANGVWIDESLELNEKFDRLVNNFFKTSVKQVDFQNKHVEVINEVNSWACEETNGLIKDILPDVGSVNHFTRLISTNAICFSGEWVHKFDPSATKFHPFHLLNGSAVRAPFMTNNRQFYNIAKFDEFKVLELPFIKGTATDDRQFSMYIFLPDANDGLPALAEKFYSDSGFLEEHIPWNYEVKLDKFLIPKFKMSFGFGAKKVLKDLGLVSLFEAGSKGLTEMVNLPPGEDDGLYVSEIFHKSLIEVNEHGTEAAAAAVMLLQRLILQVPTTVSPQGQLTLWLIILFCLS
ncbi:unnamed protein product [Rhodiola kirilowii]